MLFWGVHFIFDYFCFDIVAANLWTTVDWIFLINFYKNIVTVYFPSVLQTFIGYFTEGEEWGCEMVGTKELSWIEWFWHLWPQFISYKQ